MDDSQIYEGVQKRYGVVAKGNYGDYSPMVATAFGYSAEEPTSILADAKLGLSGGNPLALAKLGEVHPHQSLPTWSGRTCGEFGTELDCLQAMGIY